MKERDWGGMANLSWVLCVRTQLRLCVGQLNANLYFIFLRLLRLRNVTEM